MKFDQTRRAMLRALGAAALAAAAPYAVADVEYAAAWGPDVGTSAPMLQALDQDGTEQTLGTLAGGNGLILVFNRSVDW